jgi:hypothetical protein
MRSFFDQHIRREKASYAFANGKFIVQQDWSEKSQGFNIILLSELDKIANLNPKEGNYKNPTAVELPGNKILVSYEAWNKMKSKFEVHLSLFDIEKNEIIKTGKISDNSGKHEQLNPIINLLGSKKILLTWQENNFKTNSYDIHAKIYNLADLSSEKTENLVTEGKRNLSYKVQVFDNGEFAIVWQQWDYDLNKNKIGIKVFNQELGLIKHYYINPDNISAENPAIFADNDKYHVVWKSFINFVKREAFASDFNLNEGRTRLLNLSGEDFITADPIVTIFKNYIVYAYRTWNPISSAYDITLKIKDSARETKLSKVYKISGGKAGFDEIEFINTSNQLSIKVEHGALTEIIDISEFIPSAWPTAVPSEDPSALPTAVPSTDPSTAPTAVPSLHPTAVPSTDPSTAPTAVPSEDPSALPTAVPSANPTAVPSTDPSTAPTAVPSEDPSANPTAVPSASPTVVPSAVPTTVPSLEPNAVPTPVPSKADESKTVPPTPQKNVGPQQPLNINGVNGPIPPGNYIIEGSNNSTTKSMLLLVLEEGVKITFPPNTHFNVSLLFQLNSKDLDATNIVLPVYKNETIFCNITSLGLNSENKYLRSVSLNEINGLTADDLPACWVENKKLPNIYGKNINCNDFSKIIKFLEENENKNNGGSIQPESYDNSFYGIPMPVIYSSPVILLFGGVVLTYAYCYIKKNGHDGNNNSICNFLCSKLSSVLTLDNGDFENNKSFLGEQFYHLCEGY